MLYVVFIVIDRVRADEWMKWMRDVHIPDVVATGCFVDAVMVRDEAADTSARLGFRCIYRAHDAAALTLYQDRYAADLQADHTSRFAGDFSARRELLPVIAACSPSH
jgi:hypothetical protein